MKELTMQLYAQLPRQEIKNNHDIIELINKEGQYFMLLNNDIRYFTLFHIDIAANEDFTSVLDEIINDFGEPRNIAVEKDGSITIWVYGKDGKVIDFHLFKYDNGVIEVTRI